MIKKILNICIEAVPVILMILLIQLIKNDYILALIYILIIFVSFLIKKQKNDYVLLAFGFIAMIISEYFFISTGVETFIRHSLFNIMPIWLPFLWAYAFVAISRSVKILNN